MPRLLVGDAHPERRIPLARALAPTFDVVQVVHGRAALDVLGTGDVDAALIALHLPLVTGLDVARRALAWGLRTRFVLVGLEGADLADRPPNVVDALVLPVRLPDLGLALERALARTERHALALGEGDAL